MQRVHAEIVKTVQRPAVAKRLVLDGTLPIACSPAEFGTFLAAERSQWAEAARRANIRTD